MIPPGRTPGPHPRTSDLYYVSERSFIRPSRHNSIAYAVRLISPTRPSLAFPFKSLSIDEFFLLSFAFVSLAFTRDAVTKMIAIRGLGLIALCAFVASAM